MQNDRIAAALEQMADLLEIQGANPFRVRAYRNGARRVHDLAEPVAAIVADPDRKLTDVEGIGKELATKISVLVETGRLPQLEALREEVPPGVLALLRIPGLGPKKAGVLYRELHVESLDQLRAACQNSRLRELHGFGAKTEQAILDGIDLAASAGQRIYWAKADRVARELVAHMRPAVGKGRMEVAGSYRRGRETVGDLDLLVTAEKAESVMDRFSTFPEIADVLLHGETKMSVRLEGGLQIDLRVVPDVSFGAALQYFTGSKEHNVVLRGMAKQRGLKINEWGVFRIAKDASEQRIAGRTEEEVYAALDLPCFPPELREARQEFASAAEGPLPRLIERSDLVGDLHMHTTASDGRASLMEMIDAARQRGLTYIAITDHSKRVAMARGLDGTRLRRQWSEIDRLRDKLDGFLVLKGIECDILEQGGLDLPDDVLAEADWVVASIHYGQNQSRQQITDRILEAIEHPHVSAIAHPTGRLINRRPRYEVDLEAVFKAARRCGKMLELNANPARLDLDDLALAAAKRHGITIVINSDAHSTEGIDVLRYGILQARRGGLTRHDVANTRPWPEFQSLLRRG
ncbi:MAG: DNA polymerase/3'-5' exonuclease PolX [Pirellulales bacterium]